MANFAVQSGYLSWLRALLLEQGGVVRNLLSRMSFLGTPGSMTPSAFGKFLDMLKQVAAEKEHESDIISRIHEMERRHRFQRRCRRLRSASPVRKPRSKPEMLCDATPAPRKRDDTLLLLVAVLAFFRRRPKSPGE